MQLDLIGRYAIWRAACPYCMAKRGEECGPGGNRQCPVDDPVEWPHGVHYGNGDLNREAVRGILTSTITELELKMFLASENDNLD